MGERRQKPRRSRLGGSGHCYRRHSLATQAFECRVTAVGLGDPCSHREIISRGSLRGRMVLAGAHLSQFQLA